MKTMNGKVLSWLATMLPLSFMLSGCQAPQSRMETSASPVSIKCNSDATTLAAELPAKLYHRMNNCVRKKAWDDAVFLYMLAGSKTRYDAMRVDSQYARSMHTQLLKESIEQLNEDQRKSLWKHIKSDMDDAHKKEYLCHRVKEYAIPTYEPNYMFVENRKKTDFVFSTKASWGRATNGYMGCPYERM